LYAYDVLTNGLNPDIVSKGYTPMTDNPSQTVYLVGAAYRTDNINGSVNGILRYTLALDAEMA
jgi:hypothetical protein